MYSKNTTAAFGLFAIAGLINSIPAVSWTMQIAYIVGYICEIIAACILINNLDGKGKTGAVFLLLSIVSVCVSYPLQGAWILNQINQLFSDISSGRGLFSIESLLSLSGVDKALGQFLPEETQTVYTSGFWSMYDLPWVGRYVLLLVAFICWLGYKPFKRIQPGLILILSAVSFKLIWYAMSCTMMIELDSTIASFIEVLIWQAGFIVAMGYMTFVAHLPEDAVSKLKAKSVLVFGMGLFLTYLLLINTGYKTIFLALLGCIILLVGTGNIRDLMPDTKRGTGAFIAYGVLMIVACVFQMVPGIGKYLAFLIQFAALIVIGVGLFRFKDSRFFVYNYMTGMNTLGTVSILFIGGLLTTLIPVLGETLSGFIICLVFLPMIMYAFYHMIASSVVEKKVVVAPAPVQTQVIEPSPQPVVVPEPVQTTRPCPETIHERYMGYSVQEKPEVVSTPVDPVLKEQSVTVQAVADPPFVPSIQAKEPDVISTAPTKSGNPVFMWILSVVGILLLSGGIAYGIYSYKTPKAPRFYTFSENTNLRSAPIISDATKLTEIPYGAYFIIRKEIPDWSEVTWNGSNGYVSSNYLLVEDDFLLLNSIFGDLESKECLGSARSRRALLAYYKEHHFYGKPSANTTDAYKSSERGWQVFAKGKSVWPNTVGELKLFNRYSKYMDQAVIIKNTSTGERRLLIFTFDDQTELPFLIYEEKAPATGDIRSIVLTAPTYNRSSVVVQYSR